MPVRTATLRRALLFPGLGLLLVLAFLLELGTGAMTIPLTEVVRILTGQAADGQAAAVVLSLRLPRALLGLVVGTGLGLSGAALQGLFRNPLADPGLIGVSSGAALAAVVSILVGGALAGLLPIASFAGGFAAMLLGRTLARAMSDRSSAGLVLAGIAVNTLAGAATGLLVYLSNDRQLRDITFWSMGSLASGGWSGVSFAAPCILVAGLALLGVHRPLDALLLGEREAFHLGVDVTSLQRRVMVASALAVGAAVATSGIIGFVGLIVPHLLRLMVGPGHGRLLPGAALLGAALLLLADCLARVAVAPAELPIGLVTSAIGGPFFIWLIIRRERAA